LVIFPLNPKRKTPRRKRNMRKLVVGIFVACLILANLYWQPAKSATPVYVRLNGHDTNCNGTVNVDYSVGVAPNCAFKTIQRGVNMVDAGGTVYVASGIYRWTTNLEVPPIVINRSLSLVGAGVGDTIYNASTPPANPKDGIQVTGSVVVNISGFSVTGARNVGIHYLNGASGTISDNEIYQNLKEGIRVAASLPGGSGNPSHPTITDNDIYSNGFDGIHLLQGSYGTIEENEIMDNNDDGIDVDDSYGSEVIIRNNDIYENDSDGIETDDSWVDIDGNTILDNDDDGIDTDDSDIVAEDNSIEGNGDDGIFASYCDCAIINNTISGNGEEEDGDGITINDMIAASLISAVDDEGHMNTETQESEHESSVEMVYGNGFEYAIVNNVIVENDDDGIEVSTHADVFITNNTIAYNDDDGVMNNSGESEITNNIIAFNDCDGIDDHSGNTTTNTYNDVYENDGGNYDGSAVPGVGSISADPLFVDVGGDDFHLQACTSPAINAGNNDAPKIQSTDYDGNARIVCNVDMGAFESDCVCAAAIQKHPQLPSLLPTAQNNIIKGSDLLKQADDLLTQAQQKGVDCTECEKLINEAKELINKSKASLTNPIYANNLALQALEKLKQAIDCLKALLG
jgi:parallel beta-helix repeat protein